LDAPEHELGKKFYASTDEILHNDFQSKYFEQHFRKHERKIQKDYKKSLAALRDYLDGINARCNFSNLSREDLYAKVPFCFQKH